MIYEELGYDNVLTVTLVAEPEGSKLLLTKPAIRHNPESDSHQF